MSIEEIKIKLPKSDRSVERFFSNCEARRKFVRDTEGHFRSHIKKAKHDLARAEAEFAGMCWDWTIIKAYYAIHHAGNALLSRKKGVFSKDHSCLLIALKHWNLIEPRFFRKLSELNERFSNIFSIDITFQLRKIGQYNVDEWENLSMEDAKLVLSVAKEFVQFSERNCIEPAGGAL